MLIPESGARLKEVASLLPYFDVDPTKIAEFEAGFYRFLDSSHEGLLDTIASEKALSDETLATLEKAVKEFKHQGGYGAADAEAKAAPAAEGATADDAPAAEDAAPAAEDAAPAADAEAQGTDESETDKEAAS